MTIQYKNDNGETFEGFFRCDEVIRSSKINFECKVIKFIGSGAFAQVYRVQDTTDATEYAIKVIRIRDRDATYQINNELEVQSILRDANPDSVKCLSKLVNNFVDPTFSYLIFELYTDNIYHYLRNNNFEGMSLSQVQHYLRDIVSGLKTLHKYNIIHSDLKPENLMITKDDHIKIIDFGSAYFDKKNIPLYSQTRYYRAPEVILHMEKDKRIDIWSAGCIAAEMFLGVPIFAGISSINMLRLFEMRLGKFPTKMVLNSPRKNEFFQSETNFINNNIYKPNDFSNHNEVFKVIEEHNDQAEPIDLAEFTYSGLEINLRSKGEYKNEKTENVKSFSDLLTGMLQIDPEKRLTLDQIIDHPFMQNQLQI